MDSWTKVHLQLFLLGWRVGIEVVALMSEGVTTHLVSTGCHMSSLWARSEAWDSKCLHFGLFGLSSPLNLIELQNLSGWDRLPLDTWASIHVDLKASLHVPLDFLALPAVNESLTHLKAYDFVAELHQVVEYLDIFLFVEAIEEVTLYNIHCGMPLLLLSHELLSLNHLSHHIRLASYSLRLLLASFTKSGLLEAMHIPPVWVLSIALDHVRLLQSVWNWESG